MKFEYIIDQRFGEPALFIPYSELMNTKKDIESATCMRFAMNSFCSFCNSALVINQEDIDYLRRVIRKGENIILNRFNNTSASRYRYESVIEIVFRGIYGDRIAIGLNETGSYYVRFIKE